VCDAQGQDRRRQQSSSASLWQRYVAVSIAGDNYSIGGGWWYWAEDAVPFSGNQFWQAFAASMNAGTP